MIRIDMKGRWGRGAVSLGARHLLVLIGGALVAFLGGIVILNALIGLLIGHGAEVEVPDVAGLSVEDARSRLGGRDLTLAVKMERPSNVFAAGRIVSQFPKPLARVKPGRRIEVIVSTGIERISVPALAGLSLADAKLQIAEAGLGVGRIAEAFSASEPRGTVLATSPSPGAAVPRDTPVGFLVSSGREAVAFVMPDLLGYLVDDVVRRLGPAGFTIGEIREERGHDQPRGMVVGQSPPAGSRIEGGGRVDLVISGRS